MLYPRLWQYLKSVKSFHSSSCVNSLTMAHCEHSASSKSFKDLVFDNSALRSLPVDESRAPGTRQVSGACFSLVSPTPVNSPKVVAVSRPALALLDLDETSVKTTDFAEYFCGNKVMTGSEPASHCYCGHQFGYFSGQLGDGAAMYLGEVVNTRNERWELQLKGSGLTPYSRTADGRKVLRSSIREFLCSEAMHNLGIPTTRAGSCITSDSRVMRDVYYDGNPKNERCTVITRIAETFLRFGSFEIFKPTDEETGRAGPSVGKHEILYKLLRYVLNTFYPEIKENFPEEQTAYVEIYREICRKTAELVAKWQCVGFCHGVLNTDNMSIAGLTIDYGPFGFMERYNSNYICNGSDDGGRYAYKNQPDICEWNLKKFAEAIQSVVSMEKTLEVLPEYKKNFMQDYISTMRKKIGLKYKSDDDLKLVKDLLETMEDTNADFTNTFRALSTLCLPGMTDYTVSKNKAMAKILRTCFNLAELKITCRPKMDARQLQSVVALARENPSFLRILTGGRMSMIMTELENLEKMEQLQGMTEENLQQNYTDKWNKWFDAYAKRLEKETENCENMEQLNLNRIKVMNATNPAFILRNHVAQNAIEEAENGNYEEVQNVLKLLEHPFEESQPSEPETEMVDSCSEGSADTLSQYTMCKTPLWALQLKVT